MAKALVLIIVLILVSSSCSHGDPKVPCYFIFGDSLSDAGNNNGLDTAAKANYQPYGVDFPGGASGRFTNGRTFVDVLAQRLGFPRFIAPFSTASGREILQGVNYASGSGGIRMETGQNLGDRIWMDRQLFNHALTVAKLQSIVKGPVLNYLNKCLYTVNIGNNDYINNYFMPEFFPTKRIFTPEQFALALINQYRQQLKTLHKLGARKIAIFSLGQIGCTPAQIARNNATGCAAEINQAVQLFNHKLFPLVDYLNTRLFGAKFTLIDSNATLNSSPPPPGLIVGATCCVVRSDFQCEPSMPPCADRTIFAFYDGYHPSENINILTAVSAYNTPDPKFVHPVDINQLITS